jgi:hypothetical protein
MKLVRLKRGRNDFAIANIALGKLLAIRQALEQAEKRNELGIVGQEALAEMRFWNLTAIDCFGDDLVNTIKPLPR